MAKQAETTFVPYALDVKGKNTLILEIVKYFVKCNPSIRASGLKKVFNDKPLLRGGQVITLKADAEKDTANCDDNGCNYFLQEPIKLKNGEEVVVWRYWPDHFFQPFIDMVTRDLGYEFLEEVAEEDE